MTMLYHVFGIVGLGLSQKETARRQRKTDTWGQPWPQAFAASADPFHVQRHFSKHLYGGAHVSTIAIGWIQPSRYAEQNTKPGKSRHAVRITQRI